MQANYPRLSCSFISKYSIYAKTPAQGSATTVLIALPARTASLSFVRSASNALPAAVFATVHPSLQPQFSWGSIKAKVSISEKIISRFGWEIAFLSLMFTVATLSHTFKGQTAAQKALVLAEWTALKDYVEQCKAALVGSPPFNSIGLPLIWLV